MIGDLTTIARVKAYLGADVKTSSDQILAALIAGVSRTVLNYVGRGTFAVQTYVDTYDGNGKDWLLLRQWPVLSVAQIDFAGQSITTPADTSKWPPSSGFTVEEAGSVGGAQQRLTLWGTQCFPRCRSAVRVTYDAGYRTVDEQATIASAPPMFIDPQNVWIADLGVTLADGTPLTAVDTDPAAGQYQVVNGQYLFSEDDAGTAVLISYSSVPPDVDLAVQQLVGEAYKRRTRLGLLSESVGGQQTVSYSQKDMHDTVKLALNAFRRVTPT